MTDRRRARLHLEQLICVVAIVLIAFECGACRPDHRHVDEERRELGLWARYVSLLRQGDTEAIERYSEHVRRNDGYTEDDLNALLAKGERLDWRSSDACRAPDGPIRSHGLVIRPHIDAPLRGSYTSDACREQVEGIVILETIVRADGSVEPIRVLKGLPHGLDERAMAAASTATFSPARLCGEPVDVHYNVTVTFALPCESKVIGDGPPAPSVGGSAL